MTCSAAGEKILGYTTVYTKKLYLFEAPQAKFFWSYDTGSYVFTWLPPGTEGISEGNFSTKNQGSEGIGGILGFSADGDAPLRYGGDFWGFGGD
mgnify:CR=1 FL=1